MRRYSRAEEEQIRALRLVREWTRSGLLDPTQGARLKSQLQVELRRTNPFLRVVLALFTVLVVIAFVALMSMKLMMVGRELQFAATTGVAALACIALADFLVLAFRLYRFGVEEALAVAAVVLLGISGATLTSRLHAGPPGLPPQGLLETIRALIGAAGGLGLYLHFGFVYGALGAIVCVAAVPFQLDLSREVQRVLAAVAMAFVFTIVRSKRLQYRDNYPGDEYGWLQAAAFAGVYIACEPSPPRELGRGRSPRAVLLEYLRRHLDPAARRSRRRRPREGSRAAGCRPCAHARYAAHEQAVPWLAQTHVGSHRAWACARRARDRRSPMVGERSGG
jgi:hypothetical protein